MKFNPQYKLMRHKELFSYLKGEKISPINIEISPCGICNATCPWCFYKNNHSKKILDKDVLLKFINDAQTLGVKAITWTGGGEPSLHPNFKDIVKSVKIDQGLITNGLILPKYDPKFLNWIRVSKTDVDWNQEVLKNLRDCPTLGLCINYTGNEDEVKYSLDIVYKLNLDYLQIRPALNTNGEKTKISIPNIRDKKLELTPYKFLESDKDRDYSECTGFNFVPFLWEDGDLDVCAYKKGNKNYNLGNIYKSTLSDILNNSPRHAKVESDCQICCKNHEINMLVQTLKNIENVNFV